MLAVLLRIQCVVALALATSIAAQCDGLHPPNVADVGFASGCNEIDPGMPAPFLSLLFAPPAINNTALLWTLSYVPSDHGLPYSTIVWADVFQAWPVQFPGTTLPGCFSAIGTAFIWGGPIAPGPACQVALTIPLPVVPPELHGVLMYAQCVVSDGLHVALSQPIEWVWQ